MKKKDTCPICRKRIRSQNKSIVVDSFIDKMVENLSVELKNRRQEIVEERQGMYMSFGLDCVVSVFPLLGHLDTLYCDNSSQIQLI